MTECIQPGSITDDDLIAYAAGEASRRVREHVWHCPRCQAAAAGYAAAGDRLRRALYRFDCPPALALGEYQLGLLAPGDRQRVQRHLAICPHCAAELAETVAVLDEPLLAPTSPPPRRPPRPSPREVIAQVVATRRPAGALRGRPRPVTQEYTAEDLTFTLHPQPSDRPRGQVQLLGFAARRDADLASLTGSRVRLRQGGQTVATAIVDEIGSFSLGPVAPGAYDVEVTTGTLRVRLADVPLVVE